ncbi:mannose/fructose/sorbose PTS transporter subunit IIA [Oceanivirga miroungae]|uniref:PTS system mannose-specific EIIAB component n=1 Tax=Oceanivirga miroungae TaxID=1130046 RepID=A0A6I8MD25_9FUSO|nr:mannose/fructose/sorbose PTS transporter subunit IIA [Oceanivirga miroungae]VWL85402.1 PTS system mannose/fructose/sorbose family transporter subunit IIA [Oceanivirga miroungae]
MVGIIVATHGELANGLLHASKMIFGEQEDFAVCNLMPQESPETLKEKILSAVSSFENKEEVLLLVDLWSGTPFNQANALLNDHPTWALVAGTNLPMLFEAFEAREDEETAYKVASRVIEAGKTAIRGKPESINPKSSIKKVVGAGAVEQDGEIEYVLARIDTRLLHGQVATSWTKTTGPNRIIVVSDAVSRDALRKKMIEEAAPPGVKAHVVPIDKMIAVDKDRRFGGTKAMLLFETPQDALRAIEGGVRVKSLNLGSMAHSKGKEVLTRAVAMDMDDVKTFEKILSLGIEVEARKVPSDSPEKIEDILDRARKAFSN